MTEGFSPETEEYLSALALTKATNTVAAYRRDLARYEAFLAEEGVPLREVDRATVERYVGRLREDHKQSSTARSLAAIKGLHRFCVDEAGHVFDPTAEVRAPRVPDALPKSLTEAEVASLLDAVAASTAGDRRDRALLELLYGTGMRISEAVGLSLGDLAMEEGVLRVFGKGSKERLVPLGRMAREALEDWLSPRGREAMAPARWARRGDAEAVFLNSRGGRLSRQGAWGIVRRYGDRVGLGDRLSPHVLRHSCATHMLEHGADVRVVQELLGHASIATTQVYTKVSTDLLQRAYQAAHPRARVTPAG